MIDNFDAIAIAFVQVAWIVLRIEVTVRLEMQAVNRLIGSSSCEAWLGNYAAQVNSLVTGRFERKFR